MGHWSALSARLSGTLRFLDETSLGSDLGSQIGADLCCVSRAGCRKRDTGAGDCLKLAGGSLKKLKECAQAALTDYRDILAWAEYPREMRLDVRATSEQKAAARRADAQEYTHWLDTTEK